MDVRQSASEKELKPGVPRVGAPGSGDGRVGERPAASDHPAALDRKASPPQQQQHAEAEHEEHYDVSTLPQVRSWTVVVAVAVALAAFAGLFLLGFLPRHARLTELDAETASRDPRPMVQVAQPKRTVGTFDLRLPADVRSMQETSLYARTSGYLKSLKVDIGDQVKEGQLLAEIDTPEVDAQLEQARAGANQAEANLTKAQNDYDLADATLKRYTGFAQSGGVTQQQLDERRSAFAEAQSGLAGAQAALAGAHADVVRLTALQGFERLIAPFDGTVTARNYDVGALLSPSDTSPGKEVFQLDRTDVLRVFVNVPQAYVTSVKIGDEAFLSVRNYAGQEFIGKITRTAGAIDPTTRTLRTQVNVPNPDGKLFSGMYGDLRLRLTQDDAPLVVPSSALSFDSGGTRVWVLDGNKVHQKSVVVGRDLGVDLEIQSGLSGDESVVTNPGERLADGVEVRVAEAPAKEKSTP